MAGASDKARFYLEQSVPELQDLQRKKIFTEVPPYAITDEAHESNNLSSKRSIQLPESAPTSNISLMRGVRNRLITLDMGNMKSILSLCGGSA